MVTPARESILFDTAQQALGEQFELLKQALETAGLFGRWRAMPPRGLYIYGPVGRGKTFLMDRFYDSLTRVKKQRVHFHAFMSAVHAALFTARRDDKDDDALLRIADDLARAARVLCLDEFHVTDIADAMILARLFTRLFDKGVVLVATSNVPPDALYKNGLNRALFLPFIALLKDRVDVAVLDGARDYRLDRLGHSDAYILAPDARARMNGLWRSIAGAVAEHEKKIDVKGRLFTLPRFAGGAVRFSFDDLCGGAHSAEDYLALAQAVHTLVLDDIPRFSTADRNALRRFITLIDIVYERRLRFIASAAAEPDELVSAMDGYEAQAFARTASRLMDMRAAAWRRAETGAANGD